MPKFGTIVLNPKTFGFISLPLSGYIALGAAAIILGMGVALKVQTARLDAVKQEYATFKAQVKAAGDAAKVRADAENKLNLERKAKADAQINKLRTDNANLAKRLRDDRSAGRYVPRASPDAPSPEVATFDREKLERTIQRLDEQLSGLIERGDEGLKTIEELKVWAQDRR